MYASATIHTHSQDSTEPLVSRPAQCLWENVLWTDETKLELFVKSLKSIFTEEQNEPLREKNAPSPPLNSCVMGWICCCLAHGEINLCRAQ